MGLGSISSMMVPVVLSGITEVLAYNVQILHRIDLGDLYSEKSTSDSEHHQIRPAIIYYPDGDQIEPDTNNDDSSLDTWSVVWYIASFGGLIVFFLIVSCSEWCCRRSARRNFSRTSQIQTAPPMVPETPPPSYDQFAPPDYESLCYKMPGTSRNEKSEYDIYVVPVHSFGSIMEDARRGEGAAYETEDAPPSYQSAFENLQRNVSVLQPPPAGRSRENLNILDPRNLSSDRQGVSNSSDFTPAVPPNVEIVYSEHLQSGSIASAALPNSQSSSSTNNVALCVHVNVPTTHENTAT